MTPDAQMAIGSMTKSFVAALVLRLVERGHIALHDPIGTCLPAETNVNGASIEEVLAHRSGMPEHVTPRFVAALLDDCTRPWNPTEVLAYQDAPRPRGEYGYSSTNYILLGMVVEAVTGTSIAAAMRNLLLQPLGLERITYQGTELPPDPVAIGRTQVVEPAPSVLRDASGLLPCRAVATAAGAAGGMAADAQALARWAYLLHSGRVLLPESLRHMTESHGHGFGSVSIEVAGRQGYGHPGRIPGYRGIFTFVPSLEIAFAALINTDEQHADPTELVSQLIGVL
jgi:D-alanyl-D-alanine carboxypeptidase